MCEIKYRGQMTKNKEWIDGRGVIIEKDGSAFISQYFHRGEWVEVFKETVGQYTNQTINNGRRFYSRISVVGIPLLKG